MDTHTLQVHYNRNKDEVYIEGLPTNTANHYDNEVIANLPPAYNNKGYERQEFGDQDKAVDIELQELPSVGPVPKEIRANNRVASVRSNIPQRINV